MWRIVFWLNVAAAAAGGSSTSENETDTEVKDVFAILRNKALVCAGVPVAQTGTNVVVLTAAHCVYGVSNPQLSVQMGKDQTKTVGRVIVHPYYSPPSLDYDIALLRVPATYLRDGRTGEGPEMWTLNKDPPGSATEMSAVGWKKEEIKAEEVNATLVERKSCRTDLANYLTVSTRMICARIQSDMVAVGGPLFVKKSIYGVGSYFVKGDKGNLPKVFTNVANSEIYSFIERHVYV